jgi:hypothetical protein
MRFRVSAPDGSQSEPADVETLRRWMNEGRVTTSTPIQNSDTGEWTKADRIPGLLPPITAPSPVGSSVAASPYYAPPVEHLSAIGHSEPQPVRRGSVDNGLFWGAIVRSVLALVMFFIFNGLGFVFGGYAVYYAIRCHQSGHEKGLLAVIVASLSLGAVLLGWMVRLGNASP